MAYLGRKGQLGLPVLASAVEVIIGVDGVEAFILAQTVLAIQVGAKNTQVVVGVIPGIKFCAEPDIIKAIRVSLVFEKILLDGLGNNRDITFRGGMAPARMEIMLSQSFSLF